VKYFSLRTPENNPGWQTKWFYVKDQPAASKNIGLEKFRAASDLQARQSWENALPAEEMAITLMQRIMELRSTPEGSHWISADSHLHRASNSALSCTHTLIRITPVIL
jgi:hypothetical protein